MGLDLIRDSLASAQLNRNNNARTDKQAIEPLPPYATAKAL